MPEELNKTESTTSKVTENSPVTPTPETPSPTTSNTPAVDDKTKKDDKPVDEEEVSALSELGALKDDKPVDDEKIVEDDKNKKPVDTIEEYEIELSENSPLTEEDLDKIVAVAEKNKWTKEETDEYIAEKERVYNRGIEAIKEKANLALKEQKQKLLSDPDFKGEKLQSSLEAIDLVVSKYGDADLKAYLKGPGGNSLPLAKMLLKIGNLMKQDTFTGKGKTASNTGSGNVEAAYKNLYPSFFE